MVPGGYRVEVGVDCGEGSGVLALLLDCVGGTVDGRVVGGS